MQECRRWLAAYDAASGTAQDGRVKVWLMRLLGGLPGDYPPETVQMKMGAFVFALEDKPAYCFDDATLKIAVRRFKKFWPSAGELVEFADEMESWTRRQAKRAWEVVDAGARVSREPTQSEAVQRSIALNREKQARERAELAAIVAAKYGPLPDAATAPQMGPGESRDSYIDRLREWRKNPVQRVPVDDTASETAETRRVEADAPGGAA